MCDVQAEEEDDDDQKEDEEDGEEEEDEEEEPSIENINDENIGKQIMIEKHLQHQRLLKEQHSASFLSGKNSRCQSSMFTIGEYSGNFETKDNSEIYKLNGTLKFPKTTTTSTSIINSECLTKRSSKELRKLRQENFYLDELKILRESLKDLKPLNCNLALIVKRIIDNFNKKVVHYVGCRTYTGPISPSFYEKHLLDELCKLYSVSHPSDLCLGGEVGRSKLVLPHITSAPDQVLEVRHGRVSKLIKLPQNNSQSEQQISVTFTIKPKPRTIPSAE